MAAMNDKFFPIFYPHKRKLQEINRPSPSNSAKKVKRSKVPFIQSNQQYAIDAGQMDFDASRCKVCHMVYTKGEITDEKTHSEYHQLFSKSIKWYPWKNERVISTFDMAIGPTQYLLRCLAILPNDPKKSLKRVDSLFSIADRDLGINLSLFDCMKKESVYLIMVARRLAASANDTVCGFLSAESIQNAFPLISENPLSISTTQEPATVGVARIWVHHSFRRKGIARNLIDSLRANFLSLTGGGCDSRILKRDEIAFSDPTDEGLQFAKKYTGKDKFLIFPFTS